MDRGTFRTRRDVLDDQVRSLEAEIAQRSGSRVLLDVPTTFDALVDAWDGPESSSKAGSPKRCSTRSWSSRPAHLGVCSTLAGWRSSLAPEQGHHPRQHIERDQRRRETGRGLEALERRGPPGEGPRPKHDRLMSPCDREVVVRGGLRRRAAPARAGGSTRASPGSPESTA